MVRTRSQSKKHDTNPDDNDTEPMEIDEDDVIFQPTLLPPTLEEVLPGFSSDPDIILPPFFSGTLAEAVDATFSLDSSHEGGKKILLLFLFSRGSESSAGFVKDVICDQAFRNMVEEVAELWGADVSEMRNRDRVEMMIRRELGREIVELLRAFGEENYPLLVVLGRGTPTSRIFFAGVEIGEVVRGVLGVLEHVEDNTDSDDEEELLAERVLKDEQNKAFEEAMLLDQKKNKEQEAAEKSAEEEKIKLHEEMKAALGRMVEEPLEDEDCLTLRLMLEGGQVQRRFRRTDKVKNILDWVVCQGVERSKFKLLFWPNMDIGQLDKEMEVGEIFMENRRVVLILEMLEDIEKES